MKFPDLFKPHPITLPDGTPHRGTVLLAQVLDHPNISVGDFSYYSDFDPPKDFATYAHRLVPYLFAGSTETLTIGRYCQIAHGVKVLTASANHDMSGVTTFPFPVFDPKSIANYQQPDDRSTVIGHDVWIGYGAMILPGAQIGSGVIIGAGAVVRGNVPDYAIVTGNPAGVAKMRFTPDEIADLMALAWWHWPDEKVAAARPTLLGGTPDALAQFSRSYDAGRIG